MVEKKSIMQKVAILTNIIAPYRLPLFNGIASHCRLDVLICKDNEKNREWEIDQQQKFNIVKLKGIDLTLKNSLGDYRFVYLKISILFYLLFKRPAYVIIGDASFTSYFAAWLCKVLHIKYIWWNEILPFTPISKGIVERLRTFAIIHAFHHFVSGSLARKFIQGYGIDDCKITIIPDAVDNHKYFDYYYFYQDKVSFLRKNYNVSKDDFVFLYVGQFIKRKNIDILLQSFEKLCQIESNVKLLLVGGGPEKENIEKFILDSHLTQYVIIKEFLDEKELSKIYSISNALVLLSESEPWGMVVNEAMCFGLPILASYKVGASADLIDNKTGMIIKNYEDINSVFKMLLEMKKKEWNKKYIQEKVAKWNNDIAVERVTGLCCRKKQ